MSPCEETRTDACERLSPHELAVPGNLALLLPTVSPGSDPCWGQTLPPCLLHAHHVCSLLRARFLRQYTSYKTVSVTLEKGNESRHFAGMVNVSVRHRQLRSNAFSPLFPSREWGGGRGGQGRIGQPEVSGISSWLGKSPPSPSLTPEGAPLLL